MTFVIQEKLEMRKKRQKERKNQSKKLTDGRTDGWIDRQMTDHKPQTDRKTKPLKSSRFPEISRANFSSQNLGYKLNTSCSRYQKRELENYEA